jgi:hypothetical protein
MSTEKLGKGIERTTNIAELLEQFDAKFADKRTITRTDTREMKEKGITIEAFLSYVGKKHMYLFHGSRVDIPFTDTLHTNGGKVIASSNPAIAIMKAIYLNNAKNLGYPLNLDNDNANLSLKIDGPQVDTVGEQGYVYITDAEGFIPDPNSNWQYSKEGSSPIIKRVEVDKNDFAYPVRVVVV